MTRLSDAAVQGATTTVDDDELDVLTSHEVADILGVGVDWVRRQCKAGRIPAVKLGRDWKVTRANLRRFIGATGSVAGAQAGKTKPLSARQKRRGT